MSGNITRFKPDSIKRVAERWKQAHFRNESWEHVYGNKEPIYKAILAAKSRKHVEAAIGNQAWTREWCVTCRSYFLHGVNCDDGIHGFGLCDSCVMEAMKVIGF